MATLRAFLAHPKNIEDADIERLKLMATVLLEAAIRAANGKRTPEIITGRDDFNARALDAGGWEPWCDSVGKGTGWREGTLQPLFDLIIVTPRATFGKATAHLVHAALAVKKPVFVMVDEEEPSLAQVFHVYTNDSRDFQNGFTAGD
jgi:hypothetical protein